MRSQSFNEHRIFGIVHSEGGTSSVCSCRPESLEIRDLNSNPEMLSQASKVVRPS